MSTGSPLSPLLTRRRHVDLFLINGGTCPAH